MYFNIIRTLLSLKKQSDYPMYSMTYYGDYAFDDFLTKGMTKDEDLINFVQNRFTKKLALDTPKAGCTAFLAKDENGEFLYGRNYDFPATPSLLLKTKPLNGYASISIVDMMALGFTKDHLPCGLSGKLPLLAAPYLPFDGLNEKGLAVSILQVPETRLPYDPDKVTLNTTTVIRMMLDKAATVEEAIALVEKYNVYFSINVYCHYFIADQQGRSVILEFYDGEMRVIEDDVASNFYACSGVILEEEHETPDPNQRYRMSKEALAKQNNILSMEEAGELLCDLGIYYKGDNILQWSVVYNLTSLSGMVFTGRRLSEPYYFRLE